VGASSYIVKPTELTYNSFGDDVDWSYFRLETSGLNLSDIYEHQPGATNEELVELPGGIYIHPDAWETGTYGTDANGNEKRLPSGSRLVFRFTEGAFVIFAKGSTYNQISETYDGRHNKVSAAAFRGHIAKAANRRR
jgi:serine/threonine-protein kinase